MVGGKPTAEHEAIPQRNGFMVIEREMHQKDKEFIEWLMKLDPRDRPIANEPPVAGRQ